MAHGNGHGSGNGHGHGNGAGHEAKDTGPGLIIYGAIGLTIGTAICCLIAWGLFNLLKYNEPPAPQSLMENPSTMPPEPRLQGVPGHIADAQQDMRDKIAEDTKANETYKWIDEKGGIAQIPVKEAMKIIAEKGLPTVSAPAPEKNPEKKK